MAALAYCRLGTDHIDHITARICQHLESLTLSCLELAVQLGGGCSSALARKIGDSCEH